MDMCALPDCKKPTKNWRTYFCCPSHAGKYSALSKYHKLPKLTSKSLGTKTKTEYVVKVKPELKRSPNGTRKLTIPVKYKDKTPEQKGKFSAYVVERRKKRDKSMPPWADRKEIQKMYIKARQLTKETGIKHEVDHIIPSNHPLVCGLHVEYNLQILTELENIAKSNSFEIV
jgi:hypothetical protein